MLYSNNNELGARLVGVINSYYGNDIPIGLLKRNIKLEYSRDFLTPTIELFAKEASKVVLYDANNYCMKN